MLTTAAVITALTGWFVFNVTHERKVAIGERNRAESERKVALKERNRAEAALSESAIAKRQTETALAKAVISEKRATEQVREAAQKAWGAARQAFDDPKKPNPRTGLARLAEAVRYNQTSPGEMKLPAIYEDAAMRLLRLRLPEPWPVGEPMPHGGIVWHASFSPDGRRVVTLAGPLAGPSEAPLWDAGSGKPVGEPMRHETPIKSASFSPDGRWVVTTSRGTTEGIMRLWEAASGKSVGEPIRHGIFVQSPRFSPDGTRIVTVRGCWRETASPSANPYGLRSPSRAQVSARMAGGSLC